MRSCIRLYRCFRPAVRTPQHRRHSSCLSPGESFNKFSGPSSKAVIRGCTQAFSDNASVRISATEQTETSSVSQNGACSQFVPRKKIRSIKVPNPLHPLLATCLPAVSDMRLLPHHTRKPFCALTLHEWVVWEVITLQVMKS